MRLYVFGGTPVQSFPARFVLFVALVTVASIVGTIAIKLVAAHGPAGLQAVVGAGT